MSLSKSVVHASVRRLIPSPVAPVAAIAAISRVATIVGPPGLSLGLALAVGVDSAVDAVVVKTAVAVVVETITIGGGVVEAAVDESGVSLGLGISGALAVVEAAIDAVVVETAVAVVVPM